MELYIEESSRGVSQKTWDKWDSAKRKKYLKENPTSRYAEKIAKEKPVRMNWRQGYNELKLANDLSNKEIKSLRDENAELRQRLEALERFIQGANPSLTPIQQKQVAQELENKLSPEYTDKVNSIMDKLEDAYDSTLDDAIFGLLNAFPELQDKFVSNGDIEGIKSIPSKADKLELLAQMLKSLRKEDLDKVLDKIGAKKENKKDDYKYQKITPEIKKVLDKCVRGVWGVNKDGTIDIDGSVYDIPDDLIDKDGHLKVKFNTVRGDFSVYNKKLKTLEGCPNEVTADFECEAPSIKSLKGCPKKVDAFYCRNCDSLESLDCDYLETKLFECYDNRKLKDYSKFPKKIGGAILNYEAFKDNDTSILDNTEVTNSLPFVILYGYANQDYSKLLDMFDTIKDDEKRNKKLEKVNNKPCYQELLKKLKRKGIKASFEVLGWTF